MANKPRRGYATFSADTKRALVSSWRAVKSLGVKKKAFLSGLAEEGLSVNKNTFNDWLRDFDANGAIGTPTVGSGRPVALSDAQVRLLVGWVLDQNEQIFRCTWPMLYVIFPLPLGWTSLTGLPPTICMPTGSLRMKCIPRRVDLRYVLINWPLSSKNGSFSSGKCAYLMASLVPSALLIVRSLGIAWINKQLGPRLAENSYGQENRFHVYQPHHHVPLG